MNNAYEKKFYWVGPCGILVPSFIESIPSMDGINTFFANGLETNMHVPTQYISAQEYAIRWNNGTLDNLGCKISNAMTTEEYRTRYAELRQDENWYWVGETKKWGHWVGPYDIFVPNWVEYVPSADGTNRTYSDGTETKMTKGTLIPKEEYLEKYGTYNGLTNEWHFKGKVFFGQSQ